MSELAFNLNGDAFEVPTNAVGWRVRKMKTKGAPEVTYGRNGQPLVLPLEADIDDLRAEVGSPGRYRLDPVDDTNKPIDKAPAGYVMVHDLAPAPATSTPTTSPGLAPLPSASDSVVLEALRMNAEITRTMIDRFPMMMEAAATLLRAADGAGLPSRIPRVIEVEDDNEEDEDGVIVGPPGFDLNALVAQLVPMLVTGLMSGKVKVPGLAAMFDWRKASPATETDAREQVKPARITGPVTGAQTDEAPALDPSAMAHVIAIQSALQPSEVAYVQQVAKELSPAELRGWFDKLSKLTVPQAVETIRGLIAGNAKSGGAS